VWILETFYWSMIENQRGVFNFSRFDDYVNAGKENNKKVLAVLAYDTPWLDNKNKYISKENIPHFLNYVEKVVTHCKGRVDAWQIWNEPNWIFWKGSNKEFYELTRITAEKIREIDPDAYIIGGGLWRSPKFFIRGMNKAGAFKDLDAISFHPYATNPRGSMKLHDNFLKYMSKIKFNGEVWITEVGYPTAGLYPTSVSMQNLPSFVIKTMTGSTARGARTLFWYQFSDPYNIGEYPNKHDSEMFFGLTYPDRSKKAGAFSYELCARFLPGSTYTPQLPKKDNIPKGIVSFCFMSNDDTGYNTLILWNDKKKTRKIRVTLDTQFTIHDISTGNSIIMPKESILDINRIPIFITWQGTGTPEISGNLRQPPVSNIRSAEHLFFIGFDGWSGSHMSKANMPTVNYMMENGASGMEVKNILPSTSLPNWMAMFNAGEDHPSIFTITEETDTAFFFEWGEMNNIYSVDNEDFFIIDSSSESALKVASYIRENKPALCVIVFIEPDTVGHKSGWGTKKYYNKLNELDGYISIIRQAVFDAGIYDNSVFVLSSDHGGYFFGHQVNVKKNRKVPFVAYGKGIKKGYNIANPVNITDIAPTMALMLGLEIPQQWTGTPISEIFE